MVKIKTISHDPVSNVVRCPVAEHPFSRAREFQRALNASKIHKIFAKPFLGTLEGHSDGVNVIEKCPLAVNKVISGAHNGEVRVWDLAERTCLFSTFEHTQSVKGVCFNKEGSRFLSSSQDKSVMLYDFRSLLEEENEFQLLKIKKKQMQPLTKYLGKAVLGNVDHSPFDDQFITSGEIVQVWSYQRTKPIYQLKWNVDSILTVKYNQSEPNILCGTGIDRSIILYDLRGETPVQKIYLKNKSSCLSFNPIEPMNFTVGNDDSNCYSFDLRKMDKAKTIHKDHIGAVSDISFAPTGRQFSTGSFDRTIRIFEYDSGRSREVYHSKRMQIVNCVSYTVDTQYILSGSEDMNIRIWKNTACKPIGNISQRESRAIQYRQKLVQKFKHSNKIRRIQRHRHLPKYVLNAKKRRQDHNVSEFNKRLNKQANTGVVQQLPTEKERVIEGIEIKEEEEPQPRKVKKNKKMKDHQEQSQEEQMI